MIYINITDTRAIFKGGHGILYRVYILCATKVFTWGPCPLGLPVVLTLVHADVLMNWGSFFCGCPYKRELPFSVSTY